MATAHALPLHAGLFAGRYRVQEHLGRGGAAEVVRAVDERLQRSVALKVFRPEAGGDAAERFAQEGRALARLRHPGLVEVYDYGTWGERPFLVLELIEGPTLREVLAREPLSPVAAARLGSQLARVLSFVHGHGVVHRDVKPSNILIGEGGAPRLADFGVARLPGDAAMTRTGCVVGTPAYLAPEQIRGRSARPAADVYALGLVLVECLTGRREYGGAPLEAAAARLHRSPAVPGHLPRGLSRILRQMTLSDPLQRPSAIECADALGEVTSLAAPALTQPLALRVSRMPVHRRRGASLAAAAVLALAGLAAGTAFDTDPRPAAPALPGPSGRPTSSETSSASGPRESATASPDGAEATAPTAGAAPAAAGSAPAPASPPVTAPAPGRASPAPSRGPGNPGRAGKVKKQH
ncbi:serine/threonine-protein kinase [Kitasatospora sp. NBC_00315]|uniref:serine/threonine-protein kinase n=1 Tax=Kitasatospora sp. NBC_00315 TaxID=2975963 RepID=UPI0032568421